MYLVIYFPYGFEGKIWDLIVSVPDHCLSFYCSRRPLTGYGTKPYSNIIRVIENMYDKAPSAVLFNGSPGDCSELQFESDNGGCSHQHSFTSS